MLVQTEVGSELRLRIAGLGIRVSAPGTLILDQHQSRFEAAAALRDPELDLSYGPGKLQTPLGPRRLQSGCWSVYERADTPGWVLKGPHPDLEATCSPCYERVVVGLDPWPRRVRVGAHVRELELPISGQVARTCGGFLVHACGLALDGRGLLVAGSSGRGKSTLSELVPPEQVLSDERIMVRPRGTTSIELHGTPWPGTAGLARAASAPLMALLLLGPHGARAGLRPVPAAEAMRRLVFHAFLPLWDEEAVGSCLAFAHDLVARIPAFELTFRPDASALDLLEEALQ